MSDRSSPPFDGLAPRSDQWEVVVKVKCGNTLKRFNGYVNGAYFTMNLFALRSKIASAFKFGPDTDFILTYTDEDGDVVMLDDDEDLHDAAIHQKLNPLRIDVQMKNIPIGASQTNPHESSAAPLRTAAQEDSLALIKSVIDEAVKPLRSTAREDPLAHLKSAIGEAMKSIHEPVPESLAKLSREVLDAAPPQLTELIKPFVDLITSSNNSLSSGGSSGSSSGVPQTQVGLKGIDEPKVEASFGSRSLNTRNSESSETAGLKSVLVEAPVAPSAEASQGQQASFYPSVEELLFTSSGGNKSASKGVSDAQSKGKSVMPSAVPLPPPVGQQASFYPSVEDLLFTSSGGNKSASKGKGKSVMPSAASLPPPVVPTFCPSPPVSSTNEWSQPRRWVDEWSQPRSIWQPEANAKAASDSRWRIPMYRAPHVSPQVPHAPPPPRFPYPGQLLSSCRLYGDLGNNSESSPAHTSHRWIQCDGCGAQPIVGPRYKSNVKGDYDLCAACFRRMGNDGQYTRIDKPISPHKLSRDPLCRKIHSHSRAVMKSKRDKLESRFILDVTILDGTLMSPSTPFIKIWRMHNNGSIVWPLGTQLIWVGGDQFAVQTSVPLEIPVNGFPVDQEIDVAVDFVAPARPGRYISYWRLASPSGQKFGQRVWVHIQVEDLSFVNDNRTAAINFNLPPGSNSTNTRNLIDVNIEPVNQASSEHANSSKVELLVPSINHEASEPKKSSSVSAAAPPQPMADVPSSSASAAAFVPTVDVPVPELVTSSVFTPANIPSSSLTLIPVNVPTHATAPVDAAASEPLDIDKLTEEKLLQELEEMGFRQVDLNKEILRQNKYNLEQSVDDLCGVNEWDPLLAELHEMGFDDTETNKELLAQNGGSIKRAVMDLIAREKKDK